MLNSCHNNNNNDTDVDVDVEQKWLLVRSEQALKREHHTLNYRMLKQAECSRNSFKKWGQQAFS
jgi:transposase